MHKGRGRVRRGERSAGLVAIALLVLSAFAACDAADESAPGETRDAASEEAAFARDGTVQASPDASSTRDVPDVSNGFDDGPGDSSPDASTDASDARSLCRASYTTTAADGAVVANPSAAAVLEACPTLAGALLWVEADADGGAQDVPYASWSTAMQQRFSILYQGMLSGAALSDLACPDPRGADKARAPTNSDVPHNPVQAIYFTTAQASDMYLASVAHALALEVSGAVPWSLLDFPVAELGPLLSARWTAMPVTQAPRPFGSPLPEATYQVPIAHVNSMGFVCDPRDGYRFIRGATSKTGADLVGTTPETTLANLTFFLTQNSVHGFPVTESIDTFQFTLADRLHRGLNIGDGGASPAPWLVERVGCHSTGELLEELARVVNIPILNVGAFTYDWTDGTLYAFRQNVHRGFAYAWTRPAETRIVPHADYTNATALWPDYRRPMAAADYYAIVWRSPQTYADFGLAIDTALPTEAVLSTNSNGSYETYADFGRVQAVLTTNEGRAYLRTAACSWDLARAYCINPGATPTMFADNDPYGGYGEFTDAGVLKAAFDATAACIAAYPGGCGAVPTTYPDFTASNYLP